MRNVPASFLLTGAFVAALALLPSCSGGGSASTNEVRIRCLDGAPFCIISCNLGCSQSGCSATEIAENERLRFKFSEAVDPATVNGASISIRTAAGVQPQGDLSVVGSEVSFVPRVTTVAGVTTFGFARGESYVITIAGGSSAAFGVRNLSGDALRQEFTCTVRASAGILDENQQPPTVALVAPTVATGVDLEPTIVLQFSELIDTTPLQLPLGAASAIRVLVRGTLPGGLCDRDADGLALEGLPVLSTQRVGDSDVTVVTFRPSVELPGNSCVTIQVSSDLRDLAGRPTVPAEFDLITRPAVSVTIDIDEPFLNDARQEPLVSGGTWSNGARAGQIGSDGRHGSFSPTFGAAQGSGRFVWNLDQPGGIVIPATNTLNGLPANVTDGRFFFTDFVLPEGQTIQFVGSVPPHITVRGRIEIRGTIDLNAADMPAIVPTSGAFINQRLTSFDSRGGVGVVNIVPGQPGGAGGCGAGAGGAGATECPAGAVQAGPTNRGQKGQDVRVVATHAYAGSALNTGGTGAYERPYLGTAAAIATGTVIIVPGQPLQYHDEFSPGGSGGGWRNAGGAPTTPTIAPIATATQPNTTLSGLAPPLVGSLAFTLFPYPPVSPPTGYQSLDHFVVGGSGGGGGGSHPFGVATIFNDDYLAGHGGTGGGGAIALRAGGGVVLDTTGQILARGGRGVLITGDNLGSTSLAQDVDWGISSPGGGGSGGSALLQSGRDVTVRGLLDMSGSTGSRTGNSFTAQAPTQIAVVAQGGAGSSGFYRLEAGGAVNFTGPLATVPTYNPTENAGPLTDRDPLSGDVSKWISTGRLFPPTWLRYELDVDPDDAGPLPMVTYTDSGAPGTQRANNLALDGVSIRFQGARIGQDGITPIANSIKPWRDGVGVGAGPGIQQDSVTGFRFELRYDTTTFPNLVVKALRVRAQT
ncbi:MAG: Ig-like domain-containing protein [Planctomycetota bacterium]|jgi:hypothetical protein